MKDLMAEVAAGTIVIPANKNHKCLKPFGIGNSLKTKINVNPVSYTHLGTYYIKIKKGSKGTSGYQVKYTK